MLENSTVAQIDLEPVTQCVIMWIREVCHAERPKSIYAHRVARCDRVNAILLALLLLAVQQAREVARATQCRNNTIENRLF